MDGKESRRSKRVDYRALNGEDSDGSDSDFVIAHPEGAPARAGVDSAGLSEVAANHPDDLDSDGIDEAELDRRLAVAEAERDRTQLCRWLGYLLTINSDFE